MQLAQQPPNSPSGSLLSCVLPLLPLLLRLAIVGPLLLPGLVSGLLVLLQAQQALNGLPERATGLCQCAGHG